MDILLNKVGIFQEVYDKKLYIIGCSKMLSCYQTFPFIQSNFVLLFTRILEMLVSVKTEQDFISKQIEQKKTLEERVKIVKKQPQINSDSDYSSDDEDEMYSNERKKDNDDDDDDDDHPNYYAYDRDDKAIREIYSRENNKSNEMEKQEQNIVQSRKKQLAQTYMSRDVHTMYEDPNDFKKVQKYMQTTYIEDLPEIRNCFSLGALEKNSDNSYEDLRKLKRAQKSLKLLYTPLKKLDEFSVFQKMFQDLKDQLGQNLTQFLSNLTQYQIKNLEEILQTKRIINDKEVPEEAQAIRKIVKIRKNQQKNLNTSVNQQNNGMMS